MILLGVLLILGGALAIPSLIAKKQPNAAEALNKLVPFQGIIGLILLLWGLVILFTDTLAGAFTYLMAYSPFWGIIYLLTVLTAIGLGALLSYGLIAKYALSKNADAARGGEAVHAKLAGIQVPLGIAGILFGLLIIVFWLAIFTRPVVYVP
ncbi:MAG TPA: hypothetical protein VF791_14410 [Pyrinomonadaceae bacterium]